MRNQDHQGNGNGLPRNDMQGGFATTSAAMIAMIAAPALDEATAEYVILLAQRSYAPDIVQLIEVAWMIACFPFVFFAARAGINAALTVAGIYLAYRFI
ncbi:hypothetical protein [Cereibacter azotoformans]|uniref:Uncharacterized protein n=1 Tax=Cereibacter azotoformans TaxID=43057 RepID=A0A2T5JM95_9RHOB|nr:hypothetical protein [Cereibacter azotoformans]MBO4168851.1 hypothetical protein [Cereibacter azotoformans]PTR08162.1 hypothetical protein C8J28_1378 [Cereibacter azotoformans]